MFEFRGLRSLFAFTPKNAPQQASSGPRHDRAGGRGRPGEPGGKRKAEPGAAGDAGVFGRLSGCGGNDGEKRKLPLRVDGGGDDGSASAHSSGSRAASMASEQAEEGRPRLRC